MRIALKIAGVLALVAVALPTAHAESIKDAIVDGKLELNLRYRYEWVEQTGFDLTANANTFRARVGWTTGLWHGLYARLALDGNFSLGSERYNSTANGKMQYPIIPDPDDQQLNQGYLAYKLESDSVKLNALVGRQTLNLDNQRFIGSVGFRQLEQRFDTFRFNIDPVKNLHIDYMYADRVYRIFGDHNSVNPNINEQDLDANFINIAWNVDPVKIVGYFYGVEYEDIPLLSQQNIGIRVTGNPKASKSLTIPFQAEYANQSDYGNATTNFDVDYGFAEVGIAAKAITGKVGYELLGSEVGVRAFQTPLATLHKFNGWADAFLITPSTGLRDMYALIQGKVAKVNLMAIYHDFSSDQGSIDYGTEYGLRAWRKFGIYSVEFKYADYSTDQPPLPGQMTPVLPFQRDTQRFWFTLGLVL